VELKFESKAKMRVNNKYPPTKKWNVSLKVSVEEEKKIKIGAIQKGLSVAEYLKQLVMDDLSETQVSTSLLK